MRRIDHSVLNLPLRDDRLRLDSEPFPDVTEDERKHGYCLFPDQPIKYEISLSLEECPDVSEMGFYITGTVSRRHLFHHDIEVKAIV